MQQNTSYISPLLDELLEIKSNRDPSFQKIKFIVDLKQFFKGAKKSKISSTSKNRRFLIGLKKGMGSFGFNIALIINTVLLTFVYIIGIGFTSIIAKIFKKHFLELKVSKNKESYWQNLNLKKRPIEEYYRQF